MATNKFILLDDEVSAKSMDETISEAVSYAMAASGARPKVKQVRKENLKPQSSPGPNNELVADVVRQVLEAIQPLIVQSIAAAVTSAMKAVMEEMKSIRLQPAAPVSNQSTKVLHYELDKLEQYGRRENIKIYGIPESANEDTTDVVVKLGNQLGVNLVRSDISIAHRLPGGRNKEKPAGIIAKFVRRERKIEVMKRKKMLKELKQSVFIVEDLTALRSKMMRLIRADTSNVQRVWSIDGKIICLLKDGTKQAVDTPDDLTKIGWTEDRMKSSGLFECK